MSELRSNEERVDVEALRQLEVRAGLDWNLDNAHPLLMAFGPLLAEVTRLRTDRDELRALVDQQLGECVGCNYQDGPDEYCPHHGRSYNDMLDVTQRIITADRAETAAARAEVSQLRAKVERVRELAEAAKVSVPNASYTGVSWAAVLAVLAEPLGSTEDPPAEGRSE